VHTLIYNEGGDIREDGSEGFLYCLPAVADAIGCFDHTRRKGVDYFDMPSLDDPEQYKVAIQGDGQATMSRRDYPSNKVQAYQCQCTRGPAYAASLADKPCENKFSSSSLCKYPGWNACIPAGPRHPSATAKAVVRQEDLPPAR
jgi:hypothetical protein